MLSSEKCEDDACVMPGYHTGTWSVTSFTSILFSSAPFILTFVLVSIAVLYKLLPLLSTSQQSDDVHYLPNDAPISLQKSHAEYGLRKIRRRFITITFTTTIALSAVLAELILCEISNSLNPAARSLALTVTIPTLLCLLVILIPFLELQSIISNSGWSFQKTERGTPKTPWILQILGFGIWLGGFWWLGSGLPAYIDPITPQPKSISESCLERVGIIGISLMGLLSGFAAISSPWQTFGAKTRQVTEADLSRKQAGIDATREMLAAKRSRLRALERKMSDAPAEGFVTKVIGNIRGRADVQELNVLRVEVAGLQSMEINLSSSLNILQNRLTTNRRASSPFGRLVVTPTSYIFSFYCLYRILAVSLTAIRRVMFPALAVSSASTDPISRTLSIFARHVDPSLDQLAWSRQISFLLSGFILLGSFNSVLQTFHMLTKISPSLLYQTQANLALIIAQICATYVISSALLLRSNLPAEMKSLVSEALGSPMEPAFVDRWFDGWFILASLVTAVVIFLGRRIRGTDWDDWDEFEGDPELAQKRS